MVEPNPGQGDLARLSEAEITDEALEAFFRGESKPWHLAATGWQAAEKSLWRRKLADAITVLAYPVPADWRCPECRCHGYARVDEQKSDGRFGPSRMIRCVECKRTYDLAAGTLAPLGPSAASVREAVEALQPFAELADEIEFCAGPNGDPSRWARSCEWGDLRRARNAYRGLLAVAPALAPEAGERGQAETLDDACKPWRSHLGDPPPDDSPLSGVFGAGMAYTEVLLSKHLGVKSYEGGDGSEDFDQDATKTLENILTAAGLYDPEDGRWATLSPTPTDSKPEGQDRGATLAGDAARHALFRLKTECEAEGLHRRAGFDAWVSLANEVLGDWRPGYGEFRPCAAAEGGQDPKGVAPTDQSPVGRPSDAPEITDYGPGRCEVCGWTLAESEERGCVPGNCSYRPSDPVEQRHLAGRRKALAARHLDRLSPTSYSRQGKA